MLLEYTITIRSALQSLKADVGHWLGHWQLIAHRAKISDWRRWVPITFDDHLTFCAISGLTFIFVLWTLLVPWCFIDCCNKPNISICPILWFTWLLLTFGRRRKALWSCWCWGKLLISCSSKNAKDAKNQLLQCNISHFSLLFIIGNRLSLMLVDNKTILVWVTVNRASFVVHFLDGNEQKSHE